MSEITSSAARALSVEQIARELFKAAEFQSWNKAITYEHGVSLVNIVATHGKQLAKAIALHQELVDALEGLIAAVFNGEAVSGAEALGVANAALAKARGES